MALHTKFAAALCLVIYAQQVASFPRLDPELLHARLTFKEWDEVMKQAQEETVPDLKSKEIDSAAEIKQDVDSGRPSSAENGTPIQQSVNEIKEDEKRPSAGRALPVKLPTGKNGRGPAVSLSQYLRLSPFIKRAVQTNRQPLRFG